MDSVKRIRKVFLWKILGYNQNIFLQHDKKEQQDMTLLQLRYAITVADSRSMNQAAQKLFISQPSLSAAIRELEDEVGIEIFRRTNRGIQVTPDGEEFIGYARQVVEQYALIKARYVDKEK